MDMPEKLEDVPAVRVRHWNTYTDEQEDGTVVAQNQVFYWVIPDYNLSIEKKWLKRNCDILR